MKRRFLFLILFFGSIYFYGQSKQLDSLDQVPFGTLLESYYKLYKKEPQLAKEYADLYLKRAYKSKDSLNIAKGYALKYESSELKEGIAYADSIIGYSLNSQDSIYPTIGFLLKGYNFFYLGKYEKALDNYLKALPYAKRKGNTNHRVKILSLIAVLKRKWGDYDEALRYYKEEYALIIQNDKENYIGEYLFNLNNQAYAFIYNKQLDSAKFYIDKGLIESTQYHEKDMYNRFNFLLGVYDFYKRDYNASVKKLNKVIPLLKKEHLHLTVGYAYMGMAYINAGDREKGIKYLLKTDSLYTISNLEVPEIRDSYLILIDYYKERNKSQEQLKFLKKVISIDSINKQNLVGINKVIKNEYEIPNALEDKEVLIQQIKTKEQNISYIVYGLITVLVVVLGLLYYYRKQQKHYRQKFETLINQKKEGEKSNISDYKVESKIVNIPNTIIESLLGELKHFEETKRYLDQKISLQSLTQELNTNSSYLSKVINYYKDKTFTNYINDLRIEEAIERLKTEKQFRNYTIQAIAHESGFKSAQSFSRAFYKKTGIYPSYFLIEFDKLN